MSSTQLFPLNPYPRGGHAEQVPEGSLRGLWSMQGRGTDDDPMGTVTNISQARGNSSEFVGRLQRQHGEELIRLLQRMLRRRDLAEEVAQEAYLKLYRLIRPSEVGNPRALLFDAATKLAIDRIRKGRLEASKQSSDSEVELSQVPDEAPRPERRLLLDEALQRLNRIIEELQPSLRQVLLMRYVTQMPRREIADSLNISVKAVEQRLTRALTRCRERLAAHGIDEIGLD